jgi:UDP-N-acetylmuramate dehydrogenase
MISYNCQLKKYNSFSLDYMAYCMINVRTEEEAIALFRGEIPGNKPLLIIGSGTNILFTDDFKGIILHPEFGEIILEEHNPDYAIISAGAGINWDKLVEWTVNQGYYGLENLSMIPGTVGATPVQNIGAYGSEVKDTIVKVKSICISDGSIRIFSNKECEFGYRNSVFKSSEKGRYLITRVFYKLNVKPSLNLSYGSLKKEVNALGDETLINVRKAVINMRSNKLPDQRIIGNAGSFFKNPVVTNVVAESLKEKYPLIPVYEEQRGLKKLAAAWLIDQCGWKGKRTGDAGVHWLQALVLVNYGKATGKEIYNLSESIKISVKQKFGIELEREVEVIGTI